MPLIITYRVLTPAVNGNGELFEAAAIVKAVTAGVFDGPIPCYIAHADDWRSWMYRMSPRDEHGKRVPLGWWRDPVLDDVGLTMKLHTPVSCLASLRLDKGYGFSVHLTGFARDLYGVSRMYDIGFVRSIDWVESPADPGAALLSALFVSSIKPG
jgi:hypothetical protein